MTALWELQLWYFIKTHAAAAAFLSLSFLKKS
jgi:hypothetical protein